MITFAEKYTQLPANKWEVVKWVQHENGTYGVWDVACQQFREVSSGSKDMYHRLRSLDEGYLTLDGVQWLRNPVDHYPTTSAKNRFNDLINQLHEEYPSELVVGVQSDDGRISVFSLTGEFQPHKVCMHYPPANGGNGLILFARKM